MDRIEELETKLVRMTWKYLGATVLTLAVAAVASNVYFKRIEEVADELFVEQIRQSRIGVI